MITVLSVLHGNTFGGPHNRNVKIARILRQKYGVEIVALVPEERGNAAQRMRAAGIDVVELPMARLRASRDPRFHWRFLAQFGKAVRAIRRAIREYQVDLVQINGISNPHAAVAARREGVPVVWQILDTYPPPLFRRLMMPYVKRTAGALMSTGRRVAEAHPGAMDLVDRLILFHPPVDTARFQFDRAIRARARERLGLDAVGPVIGNVSNIGPQKGHRTFIRSAALLKERTPGVQFVILGASYEAHRAYQESLWAEAQSLGLEPGRDLVVHDPKDQVAELAMAFDVFWMTSEPNSEGIPTVIEEAMALGLPVVSTDVGSIREIVRAGETGFLAAPHAPAEIAEVTSRMLSEPDRMKAMGERARAFAESHFPPEECAAKHHEAYSLALGHL